jgi:hypothetical protein
VGLFKNERPKSVNDAAQILLDWCHQAAEATGGDLTAMRAFLAKRLEGLNTRDRQALRRQVEGALQLMNASAPNRHSN